MAIGAFDQLETVVKNHHVRLQVGQHPPGTHPSSPVCLANSTQPDHPIPDLRRRIWTRGRAMVLVTLALLSPISALHSAQAKRGLEAKPGSHFGTLPRPSQAVNPSGFIKGGNISAWNITDAKKVLADAKRLGLNTLTIPVRVDMASARSSEVRVDEPSLAFARKMVKQGGAYRLIIEPYPWIADGSVPETALDPEDKAAWFESYSKALAKIGREFPAVWGMYVASNLVKLEGESERWISLIQKQREAFQGKLIYRTQWWATAPREPGTLATYQAKLSNPIFGAADVIGIASYFELSDASAPSADEIKAALQSTTVFNRKQNVVAEVMALQEKWHKPIFLGELSCPAVEYGAETPWDPLASQAINTEIQKNYLSAYLETFPRDTRLFLGFSLFPIGHPTATPYDLAPSAVEYIQTFKPDRTQPVFPTRIVGGRRPVASQGVPFNGMADPTNQ